MRVKIIKEHLIDLAYFDEMSTLLDEIIRERRAHALSYEEYLKRISQLAQEINNPAANQNLPEEIKTQAQRALYHNLGNDQEQALAVDEAVQSSRMADWRGNMPRENMIKAAIYKVLQDEAEVERIFEIIKQQNEY